MPVRIYDIAKKLGIESKEVLAKAKELGITGAKVPSSSLDKITAQYLEEQFGGAKPVAVEAPPAHEPVLIVSAPSEPPPAPPIEPIAAPPAPPKPAIGEKVGFIQLPQKPAPKIGAKAGPVKLPPKPAPLSRPARP